MAKQILQTDASSYHKGFFADIVKPLMGQGLLTSEGDTWKLHHKLANAGFQVCNTFTVYIINDLFSYSIDVISPSQYKDLIPSISRIVLSLLSHWEAKYERS